MSEERNDKLKVFEELISCSQQLYLWSYTPDFTLTYTNYPPEHTEEVSLYLVDQIRPLLQNEELTPFPYILDNFLNILWIADFEWIGNELRQIYVIGPAFSGRNSYQQLKQKLDERQISIPIKLNVLKYLDSIPILPSNIFFQYAIMLHYCITGERITSTDLQYPPVHGEADVPENIQNISDEHRGIWSSEKAMMDLVRAGNPGYKEALEKSILLSSGVKFDTGDSLRYAKNNFLVLLTLTSRAAIEGGISPATAYSLCDYYTQKAEDSASIADLSGLSRLMMDDFVTRIQKIKEEKDISRPILSCCEYIQSHIKEELPLSLLAGRAGYSEYYFSRRFRQETGISIQQYIKQAKIRQARFLLETTDLNVQDISDELSFRSRSYFSDTFQKTTGLSPSEYRQQQQR